MALGFVRPARPEDAGEIARIQLTTWRTAYRRMFPAHVLANLDVMFHMVTDEGTPLDRAEMRELLSEAIEGAGHRVSSYQLAPDEPSRVTVLLDELARGGEARVVLLNGGTGISRRDNTYEVVSRRIEKEIPGFGELFRMLSWEQVGAAAMLSRAVAGVSGGMILISVPGSPAAVRLAWEKLIAPELEHLAWEVGR